jgi:hypothetical protein
MSQINADSTGYATARSPVAAADITAYKEQFSTGIGACQDDFRPLAPENQAGGSNRHLTRTVFNHDIDFINQEINTSKVVGARY